MLSQAFMRRPRAMARLAATRVVHLCGAPACGKSTFGAWLASELGVQMLGIDAERVALLKPGQVWPDNDAAAWINLEDKIDAAGRCIVETSGWHGNDVVLFGGRQLLRVHVTANDAVRRERLAIRQDAGGVIGWGPDYVDRIMRLAPPSVRGVAITVDTSSGGPTDDEARAILDRVRDFLDAGPGA